MNYPSFSVAVEDGQKIDAVFTRTVTNVGPATSNYILSMYMPSNVDITVEPPSLSFSAIGEKKTFTVTVKGPPITQQEITSGAIQWNYGNYTVRSPVVFFNYIPGIATADYDGAPDMKKKPGFKGSSLLPRSRIP